jgi:hypothetical protein
VSEANSIFDKISPEFWFDENGEVGGIRATLARFTSQVEQSVGKVLVD